MKMKRKCRGNVGAASGASNSMTDQNLDVVSAFVVFNREADKHVVRDLYSSQDGLLLRMIRAVVRGAVHSLPRLTRKETNNQERHDQYSWLATPDPFHQRW